MSTTKLSPSEYFRYTLQRDDVSDVMKIWEMQEGLCAISGLPLLCEFGQFCSAILVHDSVGSRIVCFWVDRARGSGDLDGFKDVLRRLPLRVPACVPTDVEVLAAAEGVVEALLSICPWINKRAYVEVRFLQKIVKYGYRLRSTSHEARNKFVIVVVGGGITIRLVEGPAGALSMEDFKPVDSSKQLKILGEALWPELNDPDLFRDAARKIVEFLSAI